MDKAHIEAAAARLAEAWRAAGDIGAMLPAALRPTTREEAYAVQDAMARILGERTAGWKMGATSPAVQRREGHSGPIVGRIFASTVYPSSATLPIARFPLARVEAEFALVILEDLPPRVAPYELQAIARAVELRPALEVIGNRYPKGEGAVRLSTFDEIADNGTGMGLILGDKVEAWTPEALQNLRIEVIVDGSEPAENVLGEDRCVPLAVAVETANMLSARGIGLTRGQIISTGGVTTPLPVRQGSRVSASFGPLGRVQATFA